MVVDFKTIFLYRVKRNRFPFIYLEIYKFFDNNFASLLSDLFLNFRILIKFNSSCFDKIYNNVYG